MNPLLVNSSGNHKVLIIGNLNIDLIIHNVPHLPLWGQEVLGTNYLLTSAGQSAYTGFALRKQQVPTAIMGNVGNDIYGIKIIDDLTDSGMDISSVEITDEGRTGITVAIVRSDGERAFVSDPSSLSAFNRSMIDRHLDSIKTASFVCIVGSFYLPRFSMEDISYISKKAHKAGCPTMLDTGWDPYNWQEDTVRNLKKILRHIDFFIPNMDEAEAITGKKSTEEAAEELLSDGCRTVIIKLGHKGSYLRTAEEALFVPAFETTVHDAVGAGDVYNAGFIYGTLQGWPIEARMIYGSAVASLYISRQAERFPDTTDILELVKRNKKYTFAENI